MTESRLVTIGLLELRQLTHPPARSAGRVGHPMLELKREPEVVFWVFVFPVLLALGLGIAFRNKPADVTSIAIIQGSGASDALAMTAVSRFSRISEESKFSTCRNHSAACSRAFLGIKPTISLDIGITP